MLVNVLLLTTPLTVLMLPWVLSLEVCCWKGLDESGWLGVLSVKRIINDVNPLRQKLLLNGRSLASKQLAWWPLQVVGFNYCSVIVDCCCKQCLSIVLSLLINLINIDNNVNCDYWFLFWLSLSILTMDFDFNHRFRCWFLTVAWTGSTDVGFGQPRLTNATPKILLTLIIIIITIKRILFT